MVVISTAICNKNAKLIFARQFEPITRMQLEEYIVHFSRSVDSNESTIIETDRVRYIYIPIDQLYLILITTRSSNMIEGIEILKLIYRLLQDQCETVSESQIKLKACDFALGIDDIVNQGVRDGINIPQVKQLLQMESQDEKDFKKEQAERELQAKKQRDEKMREFDKMKKENKNSNNAISR
jgi:hypothetical protein